MALLNKSNRFPLGLRSMVKACTAVNREIVFSYHGKIRAGEIVQSGTSKENGDYITVRDINGEPKSFSLSKIKKAKILPK